MSCSVSTNPLMTWLEKVCFERNELNRRLIPLDGSRVLKTLSPQELRLAHMNYRDVFFEPNNVKKLVQDGGLIYFDSRDGKFGASLTPTDQKDLIRDFFVYTMMPDKSFSFAFDSGKIIKLHDLKINDFINPGPKAQSQGNVKRLFSIGFQQLRKAIFGDDRPTCNGVTDVRNFMTKVGCTITNDETNKAIYRWGIRACAEELKKLGIFYVQSDDITQPDKIYVIDVGGKNRWQDFPAKRIIGNKVETTRLDAYPFNCFVGEALRGVGILGSRPLCSASMDSEDDIRVVFKAMGFEVPGLIETEKHIQKNYDAFAEYLQARYAEFDGNTRERERSLYEREVALLTSARLLEPQFNKIAIHQASIDNAAEVTQRIASKFLLLTNGTEGKQFLAIPCLNLQEPLTQKVREKLVKEANLLGAKPMVIIPKQGEFDILRRDIWDLQLVTLEGYEENHLSKHSTKVAAAATV